MRNKVQSVNLNRWLPITLLGFSVFLFALLFLMQQSSMESELTRYKNQTIHDDMRRVQRALINELERNNLISVGYIIDELKFNTTIDYALFWDKQGQVITATQESWKNQPALKALPRLAELPLNQDLQPQKEQLIDDGKRIQLALIPIGQYGTLLIQYNLGSKIDSTTANNHLHLTVFAIALMLAVLMLYQFARWAILRPTSALKYAMQRIGEGNFTDVASIKGTGEFKYLDDSLSRMAAELEEQRQNLLESEERVQQLSDASLEAILFHENGIIIDANKAAVELYEGERNDMIGMPLLQLVAEHQIETITWRMQSESTGQWVTDVVNKNGVIIPVEVSVGQQKYKERVIRVVVARDLRPSIEAEETIRQLSMYDALTGLPNRHMLLDLVQAELDTYDEENPSRAALATFNLNMFKNINDSMGMAAGDAVLRAVAKRLTTSLGANQFFARVVGDTFALLQVDLSSDLSKASTKVAANLEKILNDLQEPLNIHGQLLHINAGAGVVMLPNDSKDPAELLREAETAMHQAKQSGLARIHFFAHALQEAANARLTLRNELQHILKNDPDQIQVYYQPQTNQQGKLVGVEALVRWLHPERGLIPPLDFIGEAEASGLIVPLGQLVLEKAVKQLKSWQETPDYQSWASTLTVAVNVSPRQFREESFVQSVKNVLRKFDTNPKSLELELTESVVADDLEATIVKMNQIKQLGICFALDDFGTGYSSLSYLKRLPMDTLKIDRSFVMDIDAPEHYYSGKRPAVLIEAITTMAHQLGMTVLAEGVETEEQCKHLENAGCDIYQGYLFSKPLPAAELIAWAQAR